MARVEIRVRRSHQKYEYKKPTGEWYYTISYLASEYGRVYTNIEESQLERVIREAQQTIKRNKDKYILQRK